MCGVAAILNFNGRPLSPNKLKQFNALTNNLVHRGPDKQRCVPIGDFAAIAHTRLSINGVSNGDQPFIRNGSVTAVNGEVYNYKRLIDRYRLPVESSSDCEVLAFLASKKEHLEAVQGMYAFVHWCKKSETLSFARDMFGEKPLFYHISDEDIIISSELKPLAQYLELGINNICPEAISQYMLMGYCIDQLSPFRDIQVASYSRLYQIDTTGVISSELVSNSAEGYFIDSMIKDYATSSTVSDVPIALALSGGIDSTFLACQLREHISSAYTVGYEAAGGSDEIEEAATTCKLLGIPHKPIILADSNIVELFIEQASFKDSLILDFAGIGYNAIFKKVNRDGYRVCLLGHGGDELSFGYSWLRDTYSASFDNPYIFYETLGDFRVYCKNNKSIFNDYYQELAWAGYPSVCDAHQTPTKNNYQHLFSASVRFWLEPNSLRMGDSLSMRHSVEARHPLLLSHAKMIDENSHRQVFKDKSYYKKVIESVEPALIQRKKKHFAQPYMHYYSLLHPVMRADSLLPDLRLFNNQFLERIYLSKAFEASALSYYYYAKLATLDCWLKSIL